MSVDDDIQKAASLIKEGGLVAFPTETVYGLGANAYDDKAVAAIFEAKGRPQFNPLIVHVATVEAAREVVHFNAMAEVLAKQFWPGPLTFVLPRKDKRVSYLVSAGLETLAVRMPSHLIANKFLAACEVPVAAPSANISGRVSPTRYEHVAEALADKVGMILDGGASEVGLESTVVDLTTEVPVLLRAGGVTLEDLEKVLGQKVIVSGESAPAAPRSPGQLLSHYAPSLPVRINAEYAREGEAFLGFGKCEGATLNLSKSGDLKEAAANLFAFLRLLDKAEDFSGIAVAPIPSVGIGLAINDRLRRAARR